MSTPELVQQVAFLNWLHNDNVQSKEILQAVTGLQVAHEILNRLTGQDEIDKCKKECIASIADYVSKHPQATPQELNKVVERNVVLFAAKIQAST